MKWKKKFKLLFDREKIINFGIKHKNQIDLRRLEFSPTPLSTAAQRNSNLQPLKQLGSEILSMAKFWMLYFNLVLSSTAKAEAK